MSANINDKLTQIKPNTTTNAPVTTVATSRSIGGVSLSCVDLTDWPTATAVHFQTYKKKADGTKDFTTAVDMKGIVSANTIGSVTITNGTDAGNAIGDYVELNPTAAYGEGVYEWGTTEHNVDGTHASITADSIKEQTASGFALKDSSGNEYLKVAKTASAVNEVTLTNAATGNAPQISATGGDTNIGLNLVSKGTSPTTVNGNRPWVYLGYAQITSNFTTSSSSATQITSVTNTVTIPAWATKVKVTIYSGQIFGSTSADTVSVTAWDGTVGSGTQIGSWLNTSNQNGIGCNLVAIQQSPSAGSHTYNAGLANSASHSTTFQASSTSPAYILVECC